MQVLTYSPGQLVTIYMQIVDGYGTRQDGYIPVITRILYPDLSIPKNFPQPMNRIDVGLYYFQFGLPSHARAVGSYLVDIIYQDPTTLAEVNTGVQVLVAAPYGIYAAVPPSHGHGHYDPDECRDHDHERHEHHEHHYEHGEESHDFDRRRR